MVDVFISYSRTDKAVVARLAEAVKREGYSVWWDAELPPHLSYGDVITEKIGSAKAAIVVWSEAAAASEWVRAEADVARGQKKLIQTSVDDQMPPMPFNQIQFASIGDWRGELDHPGWRKVKVSLEALCGPAAGDDRPPMPFPAARPPPEAAAPPARPAGGRSWLLPVLVLAVLILGAGLAFLLVGRDTPREAPVVRAGPVAPDAGSAKAQAGRFALAAVIDDPDGFTNVRAAPSPSAAIVARVDAGEAFTTYRQSGGWWQVRTADDTIGYMSASRIRLLDPRAAAAAASAERQKAPAAPPPAQTGGADEILPESDVRLLTEEDLEDLSKHQLFVARNEIYARHGRSFASPDLQSHFSSLDWYSPREAETELSAIETANVRLIAREEQER